MNIAAPLRVLDFGEGLFQGIGFLAVVKVIVGCEPQDRGWGGDRALKMLEISSLDLGTSSLDLGTSSSELGTSSSELGISSLDLGISSLVCDRSNLAPQYSGLQPREGKRYRFVCVAAPLRVPLHKRKIRSQAGAWERDLGGKTEHYNLF